MSKPFKEINLNRNILVLRTGFSKLKVVQCEKGYSKVINKKIKKNDSNLLKDGFFKNLIFSTIQNKILIAKSKKNKYSRTSLAFIHGNNTSSNTIKLFNKDFFTQIKNNTLNNNYK